MHAYNSTHYASKLVSLLGGGVRHAPQENWKNIIMKIKLLRNINVYSNNYTKSCESVRGAVACKINYFFFRNVVNKKNWILHLNVFCRCHFSHSNNKYIIIHFISCTYICQYTVYRKKNSLPF